MARFAFGGGLSDWTFAHGDATTIGGFPGRTAVAVGGISVTFWTAESGGSQLTDLLDSEGNATTTIGSEDGTGSRSLGQIPPFRGPDGVTTMWAQAGTGPRALMVTTDAADAITDPGTVLPPLSVSGAVSAGAGAHRLYNDSTSILSIAGVRASVGTAPTGLPLVVDVNRNGTTIYPTQANRPSIAVGANTSGKNTLAEVVGLSPGDYLTVDVDQAGTGAQNLVVQIIVTKG